MSNIYNWEPFIGRDYYAAEQKALFIGESFYCSSAGFDPNIAQRNFPELMVREKFIKEGDQAKFHINTNKLLEFESDPTKWESHAFMNIIPRPMNNVKDRPIDIDWRNGWDYVNTTVSEIKPDIIVFLGVDAAKFIKAYCDRELLKFNGVEKINSKIGLAYPRKAVFKTVNTLFVAHPAKMTRFDKWRNFLTENGLKLE